MEQRTDCKEIKQEEKVDIMKLIQAEEELQRLKRQYTEEKVPFWKQLISNYLEKKESRIPVAVSKKKYCIIALLGGWLGIHCFLVGQKGKGIFYLLLSFTGMSFALSVLDVWYAAFLEADESQLIRI